VEKTNPKQTQFKPNFRKAKMNVNLTLTKDYERYDIFAVQQKKANLVRPALFAKELPD